MGFRDPGSCSNDECLAGCTAEPSRRGILPAPLRTRIRSTAFNLPKPPKPQNLHKSKNPKPI